MRQTSTLALLRQLGLRGVAKALRERAWSTHKAFGLAGDLSDIAPARAAKIEISMEPRDPHEFTGFADELARVSGDDYIEVDTRIRFCEAGVRELYVAADPQGRPIYAQWLVDTDNQAALHQAIPEMFPQLARDEALVEGAYAFVGFRSMGALGEGARQLLVKAADKGARRCFTYVSTGNTPALRGVRNAGFDVDHVRVTIFRGGRRRVQHRPPLPAERAVWEAATAPRPSAATT
jgi:hypothetical protein